MVFDCINWVVPKSSCQPEPVYSALSHQQGVSPGRTAAHRSVKTLEISMSEIPRRSVVNISVVKRNQLVPTSLPMTLIQSPNY